MLLCDTHDAGYPPRRPVYQSVFWTSTPRAAVDCACVQSAYLHHCDALAMRRSKSDAPPGLLWLSALPSIHWAHAKAAVYNCCLNQSVVCRCLREPVRIWTMTNRCTVPMRHPDWNRTQSLGKRCAITWKQLRVGMCCLLRYRGSTSTRSRHQVRLAVC